MPAQIAIDFEAAALAREQGIQQPVKPPGKKRSNAMGLVHRYENNDESQEHLDSRRAHFNQKCLAVLKMLQAGERLTVLGCANRGIASLPRRILDLKERGVPINDEWVNGHKQYWLDPKWPGLPEWTTIARATGAGHD